MTDEDLSNTTIRRFDITRLIARGGMGEVYLAKDAVLGRDLALKILRQDVTRDSDRLERFVLEARAASALNHPHLIAIYDIGESSPKRNGSPVGPPVLYIAMELVSGETLRTSIEANRLDLDRTLEFMAQVADALDAAHAAGVTHRDLKPENLMIAEGGYAKVLDFGIAKLRADPMQNRTEAGHEPTATDGGRLLGTLGYMSPEQVQGQPTDYRTDVFSFGCVLYEAITGKRAFLGPNAFATLKEIVEREPAPLSTLVPSVPDGLERIVRTCLAKDPTQRYGSMREVAADLREVRRKMNDTAVVEVPRRENRRSFLMAAVAFVLVAAVVAAWWMNRRLPTATGSSGRVSIERLTTTGTAIDAAISPDGRQARVGRVCRRHARPAAPSPRSRTDHRAGAGCGGRLLGDLVHARWVSRLLRDEERAEPCGSSVRGERPGRAVDPRARRDRQHDSLLARRPAHRVLSGRLP